MSETNGKTNAEPAPKRGLHAAILEIMRQCPYIQKDSKVGSGQYSYAAMSEEALLEALQPLMAEQGITVVPAGIKDVHSNGYPSDKGKMLNRVTLTVQWKITHEPSGESEYAESAGEGVDMGDKASSKAQTIARKYFLKFLFNIRTGDDPDKTHSQELAGQRTAPAGKKAAEPAKFDAVLMRGRALSGIGSAGNQQELTKIRDAYLKMPFDFEQMRELDQALAKRQKEMAVPAGAPQDGSDDPPY